MTALKAPRRARALVLSLAAQRIRNALKQRSRYKYVQPRVEPEGRGWKVVSPNCSRNIDPQGGEIEIAWLLPDTAGDQWLLHARDHAGQAWCLRQQGSLPALLERLCADPGREYWQ